MLTRFTRSRLMRKRTQDSTKSSERDDTRRCWVVHLKNAGVCLELLLQVVVNRYAETDMCALLRTCLIPYRTSTALEKWTVSSIPRFWVVNVADSVALPDNHGLQPALRTGHPPAKMENLA